MKKVITYGTFDLFHDGHYKLLKRAKELGDYLIVGVTTENFDESRGKLNVQEGLIQRIENVKASGLADKIIVEEYEGQKVNDILKYNTDIFAIGSDWTGKFDYLKDYCEVIYLERTKGISSTQLRDLNNGVVRLGIAGGSKTADIFVKESRFVSGVNIEGIFGHSADYIKQFVREQELDFFSLDYEEFLDKIDAVYIVSSYINRYYYIKKALEKGKHVLCESPMALLYKHYVELYELSKDKGCVLLETIRTAYIPGFIRLMSAARSGLIGKILNIDATYTAEGNIIESATYPLMVIVKLLGAGIEETMLYSHYDDEKQEDTFAKINLKYKDSVATAKVSSGVKSEDNLIISGSKGYIYVPPQWWDTDCFEIRLENSQTNEKHFYRFEGDGSRYVLAEFISMINRHESISYKLTPLELMTISSIIQQFVLGEGIKKI